MATLGKNLGYDPVDFDPDNLSQGGKLQQYAIPILAVLIFILILIFITIPSINNLFETYGEKEAAQTELDNKENELADLQELRNMNQTNRETLARLQRIIPTSKTEVVNFVSKVEQTSNETNVQFSDPIAGERLIVDSSSGSNSANNQEQNLRLIQIPVNFSLLGTLDNLRSLLSNIYSSNDFIVMTEMELSNRPEQQEGAEMDLELSKYQYSTPISQEAYQTLLKSVSYKERPDQEVLDFIRRKTEIGE